MIKRIWKVLKPNLTEMMMKILAEALTFDDVLLLPGFSEVLPSQVGLKTQLTRESRSIFLSFRPRWIRSPKAKRRSPSLKRAGFGVIHKNMSVRIRLSKWKR